MTDTPPPPPPEADARAALAGAPARWQGWRPVALAFGACAAVNTGLRLVTGDWEGAIMALAAGTAAVLLAVAVAWWWQRSRMARLRDVTEVIPVTVWEADLRAGMGQVRARLDDGTAGTWQVTGERGAVVSGQRGWCTPLYDGAMVRLAVGGPDGVRVLEPTSPAMVWWDPSWRDHLTERS